MNPRGGFSSLEKPKNQQKPEKIAKFIKKIDKNCHIKKLKAICYALIFKVIIRGVIDVNCGDNLE